MMMIYILGPQEHYQKHKTFPNTHKHTNTQKHTKEQQTKKQTHTQSRVLVRAPNPERQICILPVSQNGIVKFNFGAEFNFQKV